ncbi:MAG: class I SAM-dependent rRNA methyltransferase [Kiritimatiellae bacterium]|nr:class I SAM-dependent rRNA methyltransferase [Kiritimatiellia bacterium]
MDRVVLRPGRERSVLKRHPWIFSGAIDTVKSSSAEGPVEVFSAAGERLGAGYLSPASQIRVRMVPEDTIENLVASAVGRRASFFADGYTTAVRLVNAESDGLPGVVADCYCGFVVCQFTSAFAERHKDEIAAALMKYDPFCLGVSERRDCDAREKEGLATGPAFSVLLGEEPPDAIEICEGQVKFLVDVRSGHKTGFYLDQRDARALVGPFANGREVLNCFSYTGGFGLFARACGASKVVQVDASAGALALAKRNEALVHMCGTEMEYVEADVFRFLRECRDRGRSFDMIVLDPPKFAASKSQVMRAARGYKDINLLAMKLLRKDGILATFSCSGAIGAELFGKIVAEAAEDAGRDFQIVAHTRAGHDHPVMLSFPEGEYLKGLVLRAV